MIENQRTGNVILAKEPGGLGIVGSVRSSLGCSNVHSRDGVVTRISGRVRIGVKLLHQMNIQRGFFFGLPHCCSF